MNKIRTIGILLMIFLSSIGTVFGESESKILHVYGHDSQTAFRVKIYLNGIEYTIGSGTSSAIVKTTITFDNGDYENIDFDLNGNEKKMSHGVRFELYSHSIATNLVTYEDGLYDGDAMIEVFIESVTTPVPTESPIPASSPIPTVIPTVLSTPTQINLTIESTSLPTPVPTPQRI